MRIRSIAIVCLTAAAAVAPASASAASPLATLRTALAHDLQLAGPATGAYVLDATTRRALFAARPDRPRGLASNTKLFTAGEALRALGPAGTLHTTFLAATPPGPDGSVNGDLFLRGGGDPTFGSAAFDARRYHTGATVEALVAALRAAGVRSVTGRVVGDESLFDSDRGEPGWQQNSSPPGPLSALSFNRGIEPTQSSLPSFVADPPTFAAARATDALRAAGITVAGAAASGIAPAGAVTLAGVDSPPVATLVRLMAKPSDNFVAETLCKEIGVAVAGRGTRAAGAAADVTFGRSLGVSARLENCSGASPAERASPRSIVRLLDSMRSQPTFGPFLDALPIAGVDGTLVHRMRHGPARGRCHAKTGTFDLAGISNLSGYCFGARGRTLIFSFLMGGQNGHGRARAIQDRMTEAVGGYLTKR